ncbi:hypothetical protein [Paenibacillus sacheonensis]|uniref:Uncharacterized protein n=1 Tax=Paenibacillus sacheonensis TaxID=742054 RepID=A0A7X5BWL4_9BACL|nr:hypothetical protein [Paenibacillus sacheonensis]MBM7565499.1 hypothetical protein [Paenibacillus sacheonensis]NBC69573.1 hypothetical protein [Paenibacillus sacheonensis]
MKIRLAKEDETCLAVTFAYEASIVKAIRSIDGRRWHPASKTWFIPYTLLALEQLKEMFLRADVDIDAELVEECPALEEWEPMEPVEEISYR